MIRSLLRSFKPLPPVEIETERFVLRGMSQRWISRRSFRWADDAEFLDGLGWPPGPYSLRSWTRRFQRADHRRSFQFAIFPRGTDRLIGFHGVLFSEPGSARLSVAIGDRDWWGKGAVQEIRAAVLDFIFDEAGGHRAHGQVHARNVASIYNYQRLGFRHEGTLRQQRTLPGTGETVDLLLFGLLKEEWAARQAAREKRGKPPSPAIPG
jgi:ribosomal-protein-alanine N-acetyltransferase